MEKTVSLFITRLNDEACDINDSRGSLCCIAQYVVNFSSILPEEDDLEAEEQDPDPNVPGLENIDGAAAREALIARLFP